MNILHITEDHSIHSGGLRTVINDLYQHLNNQQTINSYILSSSKEEEDKIITVSKAKGKPWLYSKDWKKTLLEVIQKKNINIIHIHGVWMYPQYIASKTALKHNIPFIVTPHGMYEPWLWTKGKLKKKLYFKLISKRVFSKANFIHAITEEEKLNLKDLFENTNIVEIPNLIDFTDHPHNSTREVKEKYILFLGRLHEKKGIELLIKSLKEVQDQNISLKIVGAINDYKLVLDSLIKNLDLQYRVQFLGLLKGSDKLEAYKNSFVFVAPSYSEVVGMVNLEAATQKTPVITTFQTGLNRNWSDNGGILINPGLKELTKALQTALKWTDAERNINGEKLYSFVKENYSWESRINDWVELYKSLIK